MGMIKGTFAQGRTYKVDKKEVLGIILPWSILIHIVFPVTDVQF